MHSFACKSADDSDGVCRVRQMEVAKELSGLLCVYGSVWGHDAMAVSYAVSYNPSIYGGHAYGRGMLFYCSDMEETQKNPVAVIPGNTEKGRLSGQI